MQLLGYGLLMTYAFQDTSNPGRHVVFIAPGNNNTTQGEPFG